VSLELLVQEIVLGFKPPKGRAPPDIALPPEALTVRADQKKLAQAIGNVLSNAYKYSSPESKILIETKISKGFITIDVSDEGVGIPASERKLVFDRFYKASSNTHPEKNVERGIESSTGLGLAIAYSIAEKHGGVLECIAPKLKGATFRFNLPLAN
jgi:signal transduction histidine kinase